MTPPPHPVRVQYHNTSVLGTIVQQIRVVGAIIVRDTKTRFGTNAIWFSISVFWAVTHAVIIMGVYLITARSASYGTSLVQWSVSGGLPFVICVYTLRLIGFSLGSFSSLLSFPAVKAIDFIIARAVLEAISSTCVAIVVLVLVKMVDPNFKIAHFSVFLQAMCAAYFLGIGLGVIFAPIAALSQAGSIAVALFPIVLWITSGALFMPDTLPHPYRDYLAINPLLHVLEWGRMGIYEDYVSETLDKKYLFSVTGVCLLIGLIMIRLRRI